MEIALEVKQNHYSLKRFVMDLLCILGGLFFSYWMLTRFEGFEQWFDGRRSDGLSFFVGLVLVLCGAWDMAQGLYKTAKQRFIQK